jgi:hypothetical protein
MLGYHYAVILKLVPTTLVTISLAKTKKLFLILANLKKLLLIDTLFVHFQ